MTAYSPEGAFAVLIDSLAKSLVGDYLAAEAAQDGGSEAGSTNPAPLPAMDKAA